MTPQPHNEPNDDEDPLGESAWVDSLLNGDRLIEDADLSRLSADHEETELNPEFHERLGWRQLDSRTGRRRWFDQLWEDVCSLRLRYRLPVRSRWWEDEILVEALAAMAAWVFRYDSGEWTDPPGKLTLLFELERLETLLRDGNEPFDPRRDRPAFERHLEGRGLPRPSA